MGRADWIIERPVAHRGLHDSAMGVVENTAAAFRAAAAYGLACECDLQISADGEAMVFHDDTLDRLMDRTGRVDSLSAAELRTIGMKSGRERMIALGDLCDIAAGQMPIVIELKASWSRDRRLEARVAAVLSAYRGQVAVMSFDPGSTAWFRANAPHLPRGVVQESMYDDPEWSGLTPMTKLALGHLLHLPSSRPDFLAWNVRDLMRRTPQLARRLLGLPMLTWTVRTPAEQAKAALYADQMIFEGFRP